MNFLCLNTRRKKEFGPAGSRKAAFFHVERRAFFEFSDPSVYLLQISSALSFRSQIADHQVISCSYILLADEVCVVYVFTYVSVSLSLSSPLFSFSFFSFFASAIFAY